MLEVGGRLGLLLLLLVLPLLDVGGVLDGEVRTLDVLGAFAGLLM